ncbi:protein of unknown function [Burkholderia multivorans]
MPWCGTTRSDVFVGLPAQCRDIVQRRLRARREPFRWIRQLSLAQYKSFTTIRAILPMRSQRPAGRDRASRRCTRWPVPGGRVASSIMIQTLGDKQDD